MNLYSVKSIPKNDVVQTEGRLARGREQRVQRGAAVFRAFDVGRCDVVVVETTRVARRVGGTEAYRCLLKAQSKSWCP